MQSEPESEKEVLIAIYEDNLDEGIKANNFSIRLQDPESSDVDCVVVITYPPEYPEEVPPHLLLHVSHLKYFDEASVVQKCVEVFEKEELIVHEWCQIIEEELSRVGQMIREKKAELAVKQEIKTVKEDLNTQEPYGTEFWAQFEKSDREIRIYTVGKHKDPPAHCKKNF